MSDQNQTPKQAVVEIIQDVKSESYKAPANFSLGSLTNFLDDTFNKKLPKLPKGFLDFIVQYMPILNIVGMVYKGISLLLGLFGIVATLGLMYYFSNIIFLIGVLSSLFALSGTGIALFFAIKAHSGLGSKKTTSWFNVYYGWLATIILGILATIMSFGTTASYASNYNSGVSNAIASTTIISSILFAVVFDALILYVIFQIKSYYKN